VALLSNSVGELVLYPETGGCGGYSLVAGSMTGACYWGWMARQTGFQKYLRTGRSSPVHAWFLYIFGVAARSSEPAGTFSRLHCMSKRPLP